MSQADPSSAEAADREIVIERVFAAPRERVFAAWTEPQQLEAWFGPEGFTTTVSELDLRPGGAWRYVMHGPDGGDYPSKGIFRDIAVPERIVASDEFEEGYEYPMDSDALPSGMIVTTLFDETDGGTKLTVRIMHRNVDDRRKHEEMGVVAGWQSTFNCLDEFLGRA